MLANDKRDNSMYSVNTTCYLDVLISPLRFDLISCGKRENVLSGKCVNNIGI